MKRLRRASAIAVLCVLASAATAHAECAWVLWLSEANVHLVESAHYSIRECDAALVDMRTVLGRDGYEVRGASDSSDDVLLAQRGAERIMYRCLPDIVDPRGPKAGPK